MAQFKNTCMICLRWTDAETREKPRKILRKVEIAIRLLSDMIIGTHFQTSSSDESRVLLANLVKKPLQNPFREIYLGLSAIFWVLNYQHEIIDLWQHKDLSLYIISPGILLYIWLG